MPAGALAVCSIALAATASIDPNAYLDDIKFLASKEMKGRATGSPELEKAAAWIAAPLQGVRLEAGDGKQLPAGVSGDHRSGTRQGQSASTSPRVGAIPVAEMPRGFRAVQLLESGQAGGEVVFAGYGITAPEYHYDDYAGSM